VLLLDRNYRCSVGFVLIDHEKSRYVPDMQALEESKLLKKGGVVAADNILIPGAPEYLAYVKEKPAVYRTTMFEATIEYNDWVKDAVAFSEVL
jgi:catechol O-methyltransferase